jgi:S-disulfanyl-L-cysteine oxidoreductase SoxD
MFTRSIAALLLLTAPALAAESPHLGQPITEADIAPWAIDIAPDGQGLPPGSGTAVKGEEIYLEKCAQCHGFDGIGTPADALTGGQGTLGTAKAMKTVGSYWPYATIIFDYTRRAMPLNNPQSLTNDEVYALTAYILKLNGLVGEKTVMNAKSLPRVKMPNRDGFIQIWPGNLKTQ